MNKENIDKNERKSNFAITVQFLFAHPVNVYTHLKSTQFRWAAGYHRDSVLYNLTHISDFLLLYMCDEV